MKPPQHGGLKKTSVMTIRDDMQPRQGKFHRAPPLDEEHWVVNDCWEKKGQFSPGTGFHTACPISTGQSWKHVYTNSAK